MNIRIKLLVAFLVTTLLPVICIGVLTVQRVIDEAYRQFEQASTLDISVLDQTFTNFFNQISYTVSSMADLKAVKQTSDGQLTQYTDAGRKPAEVAMANGGREQAIFEIFSAIGENNPMLGYVYMGDIDGGYAEWPGTAEYADWDPRTEPWFDIGRNAGFQIERRDGYYWEPDDAVYVTVLKGYPDERGAFNGVVAIDVSLKSLTDMVKRTKFGKTGSFILIEDSGNVLVDSANTENNFKSVSELSDPHFKVIANTQGGIVEFDINGKEYRANVYESPALGWKFVGLMQTDEILSGARRILWSTIIVSVILVSLFLFGAVVFARQIVNPITNVKNSLGAISQGEGDLTTRLEVQTQDEVGDLSKSFNRFLDSIAELVKNIQQSGQSVDQRATQLHDQASELATLVHGQSESIDLISTAFEEMVATSNEVSRNCSEAADAANESQTQVQDGQQSVTKTLASVERLTQLLSEANGDMGKLNNESTNIESILDTIRGIAEQTNLLALNAAIEAARAGEQGRGFAVVADEVRTLASRTSDSTEEISNLLNGLRQLVGTVTEKTADSLRSAEESKSLTSAMSSSLSQIFNGINAIKDMTMQIATSAEEQHQVAEHINQNIVNVKNSSSETEGIARQTSEMSDELQSLSTDLTHLVSKFRM